MRVWDTCGNWESLRDWLSVPPFTRAFLKSPSSRGLSAISQQRSRNRVCSQTVIRDVRDEMRWEIRDEPISEIPMGPVEIPRESKVRVLLLFRGNGKEHRNGTGQTDARRDARTDRSSTRKFGRYRPLRHESDAV